MTHVMTHVSKGLLFLFLIAIILLSRERYIANNAFLRECTLTVIADVAYLS